MSDAADRLAQAIRDVINEAVQRPRARAPRLRRLHGWPNVLRDRQRRRRSVLMVRQETYAAPHVGYGSPAAAGRHQPRHVLRADQAKANYRS